MSVVLVILSGYILGSLPFSFWLGKLKGVDLQKVGSGNVGATNLARALGTSWGISAFILDMGKGFIAVLVAGYIAGRGGGSIISPSLLKILGGVSSIIGHNWTFLLSFKGGKGVATSTGVFLGLAPLSLLLAAGVWLIVLLFSQYISLASIIASISLPLWMWSRVVEKVDLSILIFAVITSILIIYRHRSNIKRLIRGEENRWGKRIKK